MIRAFCSSSSCLLVRRPRALQRTVFHFTRRWNTTTSTTTSNESNKNNNDDQHHTLLVDPFVERHLSRHGIPSQLFVGIVSALQPVYGKPLTVAHLKSFGNTALQALALSVQESLPQEQNNAAASLDLTVEIPHHATAYSNIKWQEGISLLQLCKQHPDFFGEYMEGTCGGTMSCCTCHVYLSQSMYESLPEASEAELDMLDLAHDVRETSRLACQVYITEKMWMLPPEELVVTIPADVVDLWS